MPKPIEPFVNGGKQKPISAIQHILQNVERVVDETAKGDVIKLDDSRLTEASKQYALNLKHESLSHTSTSEIHKKLGKLNDKFRSANRDSISYSDLSDSTRYMDELIERSR